MNIAQALQFLLDSTGTSRSKLARAIGVHTSSVSNWIDGKDAKAENMEAICEYFNCSLDYLAGKTKEKPVTESDGLTKEGQELMSIYNQLPPDKKALLETLAKEFEQKK